MRGRWAWRPLGSEYEASERRHASCQYFPESEEAGGPGAFERTPGQKIPPLAVEVPLDAFTNGPVVSDNAAMSFPATLVVLVVVAHEGQYLVVQEQDGSWYLPAGRVEGGESLLAAAVRETAEEAGIAIEPAGILGLDQEWRGDSVMIRVCFEGRATAGLTAKTVPDEHTLGARWVTKNELASMRLRGADVRAWIDRYESGARLPVTSFVWYGT